MGVRFVADTHARIVADTYHSHHGQPPFAAPQFKADSGMQALPRYYLAAGDQLQGGQQPSLKAALAADGIVDVDRVGRRSAVAAVCLSASVCVAAEPRPLVWLAKPGGPSLLAANCLRCLPVGLGAPQDFAAISRAHEEVRDVLSRDVWSQGVWDAGRDLRGALEAAKEQVRGGGVDGPGCGGSGVRIVGARGIEQGV